MIFASGRGHASRAHGFLGDQSHTARPVNLAAIRWARTASPRRIRVRILLARLSVSLAVSSLWPFLIVLWCAVTAHIWASPRLDLPHFRLITGQLDYTGHSDDFSHWRCGTWTAPCRYNFGVDPALILKSQLEDCTDMSVSRVCANHVYAIAPRGWPYEGPHVRRWFQAL